MKIRRGCFVFALVALLICHTGLAQAQTSFVEQRNIPGERFRLSLNRSGIIDTEWGAVLSHLKWDAGLWVGFSKDPISVYDTSGRRLGTLLSNRLGAGLVGTIGLFNWVELGMELPIVLYQDRPTNQPSLDSSPIPRLQTTGLGDLRIMPKVRLLRSDRHFIDLALMLNVTLPTGTGANYFGDRSVTFAPEFAVSKAIGGVARGLRAAVNLGIVLRSDTRLPGLRADHEASYRVGVGYRFKERFNVPVELDTGVSGGFSLVNPFQGRGETFLEWRVQAGYEFQNKLLAFAGFGKGLLGGYAVPDWRIYAGVRYGNVSHPMDSDGDKIDDDKDQCPAEPELINNIEDADGCPERDGDNDGLFDRDEERLGTSPSDADSDDDGIPDGAEKSPGDDTDKDGKINALDSDSDNDGLFDGLELGIAQAPTGTDVSKGTFTADADPSTTTDPLKADTDGGSASDGEEDTNKNGKVDAGERDPIAAADDIAVDSDEDGVYDSKDQCPGLKEDKDGFKDDDGCPDEDNDGDLVMDAGDRCPNDAGLVENFGCPDKDTDGDKVVDRLDNCPTEVGTEENHGCAVKQLVVVNAGKIELLDVVYFEPGKDVIKEQSYPLLNNIAQVLSAHTEIELISVEGHTDNQGNKDKNQVLSEKRAAAVVDYLTKQGVAAARLSSRGLGDSKPIASNTTTKGRAQNRRVEFLIVK